MIVCQTNGCTQEQLAEQSFLILRQVNLIKTLRNYGCFF
jgi:hypothetical protein